MPVYSFIERFIDSPNFCMEYWSSLSTAEKINFILTAPTHLTVSIAEVAADDSSALVRMLAYSPAYTGDVLRTRVSLAAQDGSLYVQAAGFAHSSIHKALSSLRQEGRLIMLALRRSGISSEFLSFIKMGIQEATLSPVEAADLVKAFTRNPCLIRDFVDHDRINDEIDFIVVDSAFNSFWEYAAVAPTEVSDAIAWHFPLGSSALRSIPEGVMIDRVAFALAHRSYRPLIKMVEENPSAFSKDIVEAVQSKAKLNTSGL